MKSIDQDRIKNIFKHLKPEKESLLKFISSKMTREMLVEIANMDYGYKANENLAALQRVI